VFSQMEKMQSPSPRTEIEDYIPDIIKGDLDSLRDDVRRYYETRVSVVVKLAAEPLARARGNSHLFFFLSKKGCAGRPRQ
jgi:hypothetical protein